MNEVDAGRLLKAMWSLWPHYEINDQAVQMVGYGLQDYNYEECARAAALLIAEPGRTFPPTIGEVTGYITNRKNIARRQEPAALPEPEKEHDRKKVVNLMRLKHPELLGNG